jgi:acyl-CoA synthetase (AMP-forming)/AMP-acid ligase II
MPHGDVRSLRDWIDGTADDCRRHLFGRQAQVGLVDLARGTSLDTDISKLQGRSVLLATHDQLTAALALIELDGVARRLVLVPPDVPRAQLAAVIADAGIDAVLGDEGPDIDGGDDWGGHGASLPRPEGERVGRGGYDDSVSHRRSPLIPPSPHAKSDISDFAMNSAQVEQARLAMGEGVRDAASLTVIDEGHHDPGDLGVALRVTCRPQIRPLKRARLDPQPTEWVLFTSGTTGVPKLVMHSLAGLTGAIRRSDTSSAVVWGTFYDIRRYGGLQIFLRALHDGGSLVLSDAKEPVGDFLVRLGRHGVTHMSGTPSHWRRALMSPAAHAMSPGYVRLSGEIADQAILDNLAAFYTPARIGHAYASTEAGVGFDVNDGREGFPAALIGAPGDVEMKVVDGTLRISSPRAAARYVGADAAALADPDGFVDTGDMLEQRGDRYHFAGRKGGIINVGGLKVNPEEVEGVINRHPLVRMSLVHPRKSPITGAIVVAEVVLREEAAADGADAHAGTLKGEILDLCRARLAQHKVPAMIRFVPALSVAASGKLERRHA